MIDSSLRKAILKNIYICLKKITFLAKGTNRDIYRSITIAVKDVCVYTHVLIYTGNMKGKNYVKRREIAILKSHFSIKVQKVSFLVSQFYSQLLLVNQILYSYQD